MSRRAERGGCGVDLHSSSIRDQSGTELELDDVEIIAGDLLDHDGMDWSRVKRTAYLLHQHVRYEYPAPIRDLRHRLVIVPPCVHGDQRRLLHRVDVSGALARTRAGLDDFGNHVIDVRASRVAEAIDFEAWIVIERTSGAGPALVPAEVASDRRLLDPTPLTHPEGCLHEVARALGRGDPGPLELARRINDWVHGELAYEHGVTDVRTTAAEALSLGRGVCQDYAHVMLVLCRLGGLPARYVSGHLLGEGGTHAWVEVLLPAPDEVGSAVAVPFDPTHAHQPGLDYLTVAVGRDYADVAPTSGTFRAGYGGQLSAQKRLGLTAVEFAAA
jgi:transglutaminase-like putative cysteine protease